MHVVSSQIGREEQRLYTYSAHEIRMSHLCGCEHHDSTRTSASCPSSDWAGFKQIYGLRRGNRGIFGSDLNHARNYEELITRVVEQ